MASRNETTARLLPKTALPDQEREDAPFRPSGKSRLVVYGLAAVTALLLAFVLLPHVPRLKKGDIASKDIEAPATMYVEYAGPDQTVLFTRVTRGEVIVEAGRRVTDRSAAIIAEIARREGVGDRPYAYAGLTILILLVFYLFFRDIKRYRPALTGDKRKLVLLVFLLLITVVIAQFSRTIMLLIADAFSLDAATVGFALPVASGAMLVSLLLDFHLALAFSFIVSLLLGMVTAVRFLHRMTWSAAMMLPVK